MVARSQVHFHLVGERFTPHDVTFSIASAKELTESALASVCSTHSASASIASSSSSLRNRRLADIAESAEEGQPLGQNFRSSSPESKEQGRSGPAVIITAHDSTLSMGSVMEEPFSPSEPRQGELLTPAWDGLSTQGLSAGSLDQRRGSAPSDTRPPITDYYASLYTPKVKLGPRLSADTIRRPHTANSNNSTFTASFEDIRPVASVPKSVQISHRKAGHSKERANSVTSDSNVPRPRTASSTLSEDSTTLSVFHLPPPVPEVAVVPHSPPPTISPVLSPEKQRLMRALQLRKNTMKHEGEHATDASNVSPPSAETGATGKEVSNHDNKQSEQEFNPEDRLDQSKDGEVDDQVENTKVRGSESEHDSDGSSVRSVEIAVAEPRPVSALLPRGPVTVNATQGAQRPSILVTSEPKKPSVAPIVLTKRGQKENSPGSEDSVVEMARSVSAPFLNNARRERASVAVPRTVTVSSGSVFQRIKQLEMLNHNAPPASTPVRTPSTRSTSGSGAPPSTSPSPRKTLSKAKGTTAFPLERTPSPQAPRPFSPIMPKLKRIEVKPDPKPMPLEVTTKIPRNTEILQPPSMVATPIANQPIPSILVATQIPTQPMANIMAINPTNQKKPKKAVSASPVVTAPPSVHPSIQDLEVTTPMASNRRSLDMSSIFSGASRKGSISSIKEKTSFREKASALLHKLNMDVENLLPLPMSPLASPKSASPVSPISTADKPKSIFGRDKEKSSEKRQEKKQEKEKNRSRSRSPKAEKKSLLRRMSSLTRKAREPAAPVVQAPVQPPPKTNLLAGWVNVQLPDTMVSARL